MVLNFFHRRVEHFLLQKKPVYKLFEIQTLNGSSTELYRVLKITANLLIYGPQSNIRTVHAGPLAL